MSVLEFLGIHFVTHFDRASSKMFPIGGSTCNGIDFREIIYNPVELL